MVSVPEFIATDAEYKYDSITGYSKLQSVAMKLGYVPHSVIATQGMADDLSEVTISFPPFDQFNGFGYGTVLVRCYTDGSDELIHPKSVTPHDLESEKCWLIWAVVSTLTQGAVATLETVNASLLGSFQVPMVAAGSMSEVGWMFLAGGVRFGRLDAKRGKGWVYVSVNEENSKASRYLAYFVPATAKKCSFHDGVATLVSDEETVWEYSSSVRTEEKAPRSTPASTREEVPYYYVGDPELMEVFRSMATIPSGLPAESTGFELLTPNEWILRKTEQKWVEIINARSSPIELEGEKIQDGVKSYIPGDVSDVVGPSILSQLISGAEKFGKEVVVKPMKVQAAEVCHASNFNESWSLFTKESHGLLRPKHAVYVLGRKHARIRKLNLAEYVCARNHTASSPGICNCGLELGARVVPRIEERMVPAYKDAVPGSLEAKWNAWMEG